jgi:hypothetical protein
LKETKTMTSHKTISSLSIAAIALLVAAAPSFAQAQLDQSSRDMQSSVDTQAIEQTIAFNTEFISGAKLRVATPATSEVERTAVKNFTRTARPMLSASDFRVQSNLTAGTDSQFVTPKMSFYYDGVTEPNARKQFRSDDYDPSSNGRKALTFVPSRGQKQPDQQSW